MNKQIKWITGSLVVFLALTGNAGADENKNVEFSLMGGAAIPTTDGFIGDVGGKVAAAPSLKASLLWQAVPALAIGLETGYAMHPKSDISMPSFYLPPLTYKRSVLQVTPEIQVGTWLGSIKPYLTFGGGLYRIHEELGIEGIPGSPFEMTNNYAGINGGAGLLVKLGETVAIGPDLRYHHVLTSDDDFHYVDATLRLAVRF